MPVKDVDLEKGRRMSKDLKTEDLPKDAKPVNSSASSVKSDSVIWKDSDILEHALTIAKSHMEASRASGFSVQISYNDLRILADSVSIAITRTREGNRLGKIMDERFEAIRTQLAHIKNLATLKVTTNETD